MLRLLTWHSEGHRGACCGQSSSFGRANRSLGSLSLAVVRNVRISVFISSWFVFILFWRKFDMKVPAPKNRCQTLVYSLFKSIINMRASDENIWVAFKLCRKLSKWHGYILWPSLWELNLCSGYTWQLAYFESFHASRIPSISTRVLDSKFYD